MTDDSSSLLPYAGIGGLAVCCLALEVLGGAAILSGLAAAIGLSTGLTYAVVIGLGGLATILLAVGYQQLGELTHG